MVCVQHTNPLFTKGRIHNPYEHPHPYLSIPSSVLHCLWPPGPDRQSDIFNSFYCFITLTPGCFTFPQHFPAVMLHSLQRQPWFTEMSKAISSPVIFWPPKNPILGRGLLRKHSETQMNRGVTMPLSEQETYIMHGDAV